MALFTESELRQYASTKYRQFNESDQSRLLKAAAQTGGSGNTIFLSHSKMDDAIIRGLYDKLQDLGYTVYVDWINDPQLDRSNVNKATAVKLKSEMNNSKCLFFAHSENSPKSMWMPWELGYFDGIKPLRVAILPIIPDDRTSFNRQEYLSLYPYVDNTQEKLYIHDDPGIWVNFDNWLQGQQPSKHS